MLMMRGDRCERPKAISRNSAKGDLWKCSSNLEVGMRISQVVQKSGTMQIMECHAEHVASRVAIVGSFVVSSTVSLKMTHPKRNTCIC
jgi:hypothetical protein